MAKKFVINRSVLCFNRPGHCEKPVFAAFPTCATNDISVFIVLEVFMATFSSFLAGKIRS